MGSRGGQRADTAAGHRRDDPGDHPPDRATRGAAGRAAYFYAVVRLVPRVERGERINVGVVLFSRGRRFLGMRAALDRAKLAALAPDCDPEPVRRQLDALVAVAEGLPHGGPVARLDAAERFHWLSAPASTILQPSPVHTGLTDDPAATLDRLFRELVLG